MVCPAECSSVLQHYPVELSVALQPKLLDAARGLLVKKKNARIVVIYF